MNVSAPIHPEREETHKFEVQKAILFAEREITSVWSSLVGVAIVTLCGISQPANELLFGAIILRLASLWFNHHMASRILANARKNIVVQGQLWKLACGLAVGGTSWALLFISVWDDFTTALPATIIAATALSAVTIVTLTIALDHRANFLFRLGHWGIVFPYMLVHIDDYGILLPIGSAAIIIVLHLFGKTVSDQALESIRTRLENAALNESLILTNEGLEQALIRSEYLANHDCLTGLLNRRAFERELAIMPAEKTYILLCDIDKFKPINDIFGHDVGDVVIQSVSDLLKKSVRKGDYVCRWGGEEFIIALPLNGDESILVIAERMLHMVENHRIKGLPKSVKTTMSIGIALWDGESPLTKTIAEADAAMYHVKSMGGNAIKFAD